MRLVAVSRVLDEDDILEAFVRHHAALVHHHILLDNGSTDRSLAILKALRAEGLPLTVLQNQAAHFCEPPVLTALYRMAASMGADWVLMLDCDEFLDTRQVTGDLGSFLAQTAEGGGVVGLPIAAYHSWPDDDADDLLVPRRIRHREPALQAHAKVALSGSLAAANVTVEAGSHAAVRDGQPLAAPLAQTLPLAHFQRRSPYRLLAKNVRGRLKVIAAGQTASEHHWSVHYNQVFETIRDRPEALLRAPSFLTPGEPAGGLILDPIAYLGGPLRYTEKRDEAMAAIAALAAYGEALASQHARLLDTNEGVRLQLHNWSLTWTHLG